VSDMHPETTMGQPGTRITGMSDNLRQALASNPPTPPATGTMAAAELTPGQAFRATLTDRWIVRGRPVDDRAWVELAAEERDDFEAAAQAAITAGTGKILAELRRRDLELADAVAMARRDQETFTTVSSALEREREEARAERDRWQRGCLKAAGERDEAREQLEQFRAVLRQARAWADSGDAIRALHLIADTLDGVPPEVTAEVWGERAAQRAGLDGR